MALNYFI